MSAEKKIMDRKILRELVPLNTLSQARFDELSGKIAIQEVRAGQYLFRIDDRDNQAVFLLDGEVSLLDRSGGLAGKLIAGSGQGRYPIADAQPRALSARAAKKCVVARIDAGLLDAFLSWDQSNNAEAVAIGADGGEDWMTKMLQSQAFEKIPPAKIQKLLLKMDAVRLKAGARVIRQGEDGDFFYTIQNGRCAVTRRDTPQAEDRLLAELSGGDCFGEEALVSNVKRNATVTMTSDGVLMRLAKEDFTELLQKPLIRYVDYEKAAVMVDEGAVWVDVRTVEEYDKGALEDSVNIPLASVRGEITELVFNVSYIICCENGKSSETAAFILGHKGFDVYVLQGGLQAAPDSISHDALDESRNEPAPVDRDDPEPAAQPVVEAVEVAGSGQEIARLLAGKRQLEADLSRAQQQKASIERVVDEQKKLHALDKEQIARAVDENRCLKAALQDETRRLESRIGKLQDEKQAATGALDSQIQEWVRERSFFKSENDEARQCIADLQKQLEQAREKDNGDRPDLRKELEELISRTNKKIENKEFQCVELKQGQSRLQANLKSMREERDSLQQKLGMAVNDAAKQQQETDDLRAQLESLTASTDEHAQALQLQLETLRLQHEDTKRHTADTQAQFSVLEDELVALKAAEARHRQEVQAAAGDLESQKQEWGRERDLLVSANEQAQQRIERLKAQLASISGDADEQLQDARLQLEAMRQQHEEMQRQSAERLAQLDSVQDQMASMETAMAGLEQEALLHVQQKEALQQALEQRDVQERSMQAEHEQLLLKANDDLTRKNDSERELQGQIDRLRKKLEQTTLELQNAREAEQADIDSIREELHAERSARAAERVEMAGRQRELKEQLAAVASEHEENLLNHSDAIEQARLQQMRETQLETESRFEELQHELEQAHDEIAVLEKREKQRLKEAYELSEERQRQNESSLEQLHTQAEQLRQERDTALVEQRSLLEKMNSLRAGEGLVPAEEVSALRSELEEARKDAEVSEGLRAEAETACTRMREDMDMLQKQVGNNLSLGRAMSAAAPGQKPQQPVSMVSDVQPVTALPAATLKTPSALNGQQSRGIPTAGGRKRLRLAGVISLVVIVMTGLVFGLTPFIGRPVAVISQALDDARDFAGMYMPRDDATGTPQRAGQPVLTTGQSGGQVIEPAAPVAQAVEVQAPPSPVPQSRTIERPRAILPSAARQQGQATAGSSSIVAAPAIAAPQPASEPDPVRKRLQAAGSFRDNLQDGGVAPLMVKLPAAGFMMGSKGNSLNIDEGPQHKVSLSRFAISKYEVTFADYDRFARATGMRLPHDNTWGRGDHPAINVSWNDAQAYVRWLSAQTGHGYHLPTEAQWEYAARADAMTPYPWDAGAENVPANCFDCGSEWDHGRTTSVGNFPANHFGLHDMGGNVQEWTEDCYRGSYDGAPADGSPVLTSGCTQRVVRGGAYSSPMTSLRSTSRGQFDQDTRLDNLGFRIVRKY